MFSCKQRSAQPVLFNKPEDVSRLLDAPLTRGPDSHTERGGRARELNKALRSWQLLAVSGRAPSLPVPRPCGASGAARFGKPLLDLVRASCRRRERRFSAHRCLLGLLEFHQAASGNL